MATPFWLTYYGNGETSGTPPVDGTTYLAPALATLLDNTDLVKTGYTFDGWYHFESGAIVYYDVGDGITGAGELEIYANWKAVSTSLVSPTVLKTHVTTTLTDDALQQIIDGIEADIIDRFGASTAITEEFEDDTPGDLLFPKRKVASVSSVVEKWPDTFIGGMSTTILDSTDYEIGPGGTHLRRLDTGTHPLTSWGSLVTVSYLAVSETAKRIMAIINLCKLDLAYNGLVSETVGGGEYRMELGDYTKQREAIMASLGSAQRKLA